MLEVHDFESASRACLNYLQSKFGFKLWMVTRTEGNDWIVLHTADQGYNVTAGTVFQWADSFCSEMVKGNGPCIAPQSDAVPAYLNAPIGQQVNIKAYIGFPLSNEDGSLFGTICAIDPEPKEQSLLEHEDTIKLITSMLNVLLIKSLKLQDQQRISERLAYEAHQDALTKLPNRRAWDTFIAKEEERCHRYGHLAAIIVIDLDNIKETNDALGHIIGDELIIKAGQLLSELARESDIVARLGGDEFGLIAVECNSDGGNALLKHLRLAFEDSHIQASFGLAIRNPAKNILATWDAADRAMYQEKKRKKSKNFQVIHKLQQA